MTETLGGSSRRSYRRHDGWAGGLILILLGIIFLGQQFGWQGLHNWWALFILIPAIANFATAATLYQRSGRFTPAVRGGLVGGVIVLAVALMFLLDLSWAIYWPLFVLLPGLGLMAAGLPLADGWPEQAERFARPWLVGTGLAAILLALGFLSHNLGWFSPAEIMPRWWALVIFLPALGGVIAAARLFTTGASALAALGSLVAAGVVAAVAVGALLGVSGQLLGPLAMIVGGIVLLLATASGRRA